MKKNISARMTQADRDGLTALAYHMKPESGRIRSKAIEHLLMNYRVTIQVVELDDLEYDEDIEHEDQNRSMASYTISSEAHSNLVNQSRELNMSQAQILSFLIQHALSEEEI